MVFKFQDAAEDVQIKTEPDGDVEIQSYPVLMRLSVKLTDCRAWLQGQDFLSLGKKSELKSELRHFRF